MAATLAGVPARRADEVLEMLGPADAATRKIGTVLLSSHVLSEVDQTADGVLVIGGGRIVADGPPASLTTSSRSLVRAKDVHRLAESLQRGGIAVQPTPDGFLAAHAPVEQVSSYWAFDLRFDIGLNRSKTDGRDFTKSRLS